MLSLSNFLKALSGIAPLKARAAILTGDAITAEERKDIYLREHGLYLVECVGPDAAAAILAAYQAGSLPMKKSSLQPALAPAAEAYLARDAELRAEIAERQRRDLAAKDPSLVLERDFWDHSLMNEVFFKGLGKGGGSMTLAGIAVTKSLLSYQSNSGKSTSWKVSFSWVGSDGKHHVNDNNPAFAANRRNDPDRNWGLHE